MRVLLFSNFALPNSCANAARVFTFAKILKSNKIDVSLLGIAYSPDSLLSGEYDGLKYEMIQAESTKHRFQKNSSLDKKIVKKLYEIYEREEFDTILLSNFYFLHTRVITKFAKENDIYLIVNQVEWYERDNTQFDGLTGKIRFIQNRIALMYTHPRMKNIIAISTLLGDYYRNKGCNVLVIPTVVDVNEYTNLSNIHNEKTIIAYAGNPARKDYIANVVVSLEQIIRELGEKIELHIYGATEHDLVAIGVSDETIEKLHKVLFCYGKIPYEMVKDRISQADFTILLRPNKRYANAGFPTKVGESMAAGVPVIANITSDLGMYIKDGVNGLICSDETPHSCSDTIRRAMQLKLEDKEKMRKNARKKAEEVFDYHVYIQAFQKYLQQLEHIE